MKKYENLEELNNLLAESKYIFNGKRVPRVTTIISSMIHEESLMKWANYLGFKHQDYQTVTQQAFDIGTATHERIEQLLHGSNIEESDLIPVKSFWEWYQPLKFYNKIKTIYTEKSIVCELFGGTLDAVLQINGKTYLIDFKTSKHVTYKYFLQLAAYRKMLRESEGMNLDGVIILQLNKFTPSFNEFLLTDNAMLDFYEESFVNLANAYISILKCKLYYDSYLLTLENKKL